MRPIDERESADFTARARIREAALAHFAERGVKGATIRGIAEAAQVSPGLVQHHFGSKEQLREACDAYVLDYIRGNVVTGIDQGGLESPSFVDTIYRTAPPLMRYLGRALVDGSPAAATVFDHLLTITEQYLIEHSGQATDTDFRGQATVMVAMRLGAVVLSTHVERALGGDMYSAPIAARIGRASLDILSPAFIGEDVLSRARTGLDRYQNPTPDAESGAEHHSQGENR